MNGDSTVCSECGNPKFACECEFRPEYLPPDGQERCPNCHGPQDRCVCAPSPETELSLTLETLEPTIVVEGSTLSQIDQGVLVKLLEHEFSTDCSISANGGITISNVQKEAVADYFRQLGYSVVTSNQDDDGDDISDTTDDTAIYTSQSTTDNQTRSTQPDPGNQLNQE